MEINISEDSPSSSLLGQHPKMVSVRSDTRYVGKEPVTVRRLDEVVSDTAAIMVKMDVQGYEKQVLKGAAGIMGQIKIIFAEMPLEVLYEGAATFEELYRDIVKLGFRCTDIERGMIDKKRLETLQINALFVRSD